jgi:calcineurin-like phosphoesterase family protein
MEKIYLVADLHFGHKNIIEYENRPFKDIFSMDKEISSNWNAVVSNKDKIFVLGDVSFHGKERTKNIISKLNGHKILVMGNHDRGRSINWWYDIGFNEVYKYPILIKDFFMLSHEPPHYIPQNTPYFYLYGHVHSSEMYKTITKTSACTSIERWDYKPVNLEKILDLSKVV